MSWNPEQYLKFEEPRLRPAFDLLARIAHDDPRSICDLGCGTGSMTRVLAERWPRAHVCGVDASASMLAKARQSAPSIEWIEGDLAKWTPERPMDVIYSNAALHWLGDHEPLLQQLMSFLGTDGVLAVQMPGNFTAPSHTCIGAAVRDGPWRDVLEPLLKPNPVADSWWYFDVLSRAASQIDIWETVYLQVLTGRDPVKEWTKGTWLAPLLGALQSPEREAFEENYAARVRQAYPTRADGRTLFPFRRLFIVARK
jgi:trans-aconitate 2-methyltransferase